MEAGLARLARQPGKRDEFLLCLYENISSRLPGQFCCFDVDLTVVKNNLRRYPCAPKILLKTALLCSLDYTYQNQDLASGLQKCLNELQSWCNK
jgi:hypothetical protein